MRHNLFLAALAAVLAVPTVLALRSDAASFTHYEEVPRLFDGFSPERIHAVVITNTKLDEKGDPVKGQDGTPQRDVLQLARRDADHWMIANTEIAGAPVANDRLAVNVLQHVESIRRDEKALVATSASDAQLEEFELTDTKGMLIQCLDQHNQPVAELYKGKTAGAGQVGEDAVRGFYVRRKDHKDVVLYEQAYWNVSTDKNLWIERNPIARTAASEAVELRLKNATGMVVLAKEKPADVEWKLQVGPGDLGAVRQALVGPLVSQVSSIQIRDYVQALPQGPGQAQLLQQHGLADPEIVVAVKTADGAEHTVSIGNKVTDKNEFYARISGLEFLVTIGDWNRSPFEKDPRDLFDPPAGAAPKDEPPKETKGDGDKSGGGETGTADGPRRG
jgi:hypothetical protein